MKPERDPFAHRSLRSRALGLLAAVGLAGIMLTALQLVR